MERYLEQQQGVDGDVNVGGDGCGEDDTITEANSTVLLGLGEDGDGDQTSVFTSTSSSRHHNLLCPDDGDDDGAHQEHEHEHDNTRQQHTGIIHKVTKEAKQHHGMSGERPLSIPDQILLPSSSNTILIKDMISATVEHVLFNGGTIQKQQARYDETMMMCDTGESLFLDSSDSDVLGNSASLSKGGEGYGGCITNNNKRNFDGGKRNSTGTSTGDKNEKTMLLVRRHREDDIKLYHSAIIGGGQGQGEKESIDAAAHTSKNNENNNSLQVENNDCMAHLDPFYDDDDIEIPSEFLVKPHAATKTNATSTAASSIIHSQQQQQQQQEYINLLQKPLPVNDPVKYNNTVQERHSYYTTKGVDRYWDEEFGDGFDPMMFVEERCRGTTAASKPDDDYYYDDTMKDGGKTDSLAEQQSNSEPEQEGKVASTILAENYTASLLQRCWDRAVHAASSSIIVPQRDIAGRQQVKLDKTMPIICAAFD